MSRLFQTCVVPSQFTDIGQMLNNHMLPETAQSCHQFAQCVNARYNLPKDVWRIIVREVCKLEVQFKPDRWYGDAYQWFWDWLKSPDLQRLNPLVVIDDTQMIRNQNNIIHWMKSIYGCDGMLKDDNHFLGIPGETYRWQLGDILKVPLNGWRHPQPDIKMYKFTIPKTGDLFVGIAIHENMIQFIEKINYIIGGQVLKSSFDLNSPIRFPTFKPKSVQFWEENIPPDSEYFDNDSILIYHDPIVPVLPLISLAYHIVEIQIELKHGSRVIFPDEIKCLYTYPDNRTRRSLPQHAFHLNEELPFHEAGIFGGMFGYRFESHDIERIMQRYGNTMEYHLTGRIPAWNVESLKQTYKYRYLHPDPSPQ